MPAASSAWPSGSDWPGAFDVKRAAQCCSAQAFGEQERGAALLSCGRQRERHASWGKILRVQATTSMVSGRCLNAPANPVIMVGDTWPAARQLWTLCLIITCR